MVLSSLRRCFICLVLLALLAACSPAPLPTSTPAPTLTPSRTTIPALLLEAAAEFCPAPRNWTIIVTQPGDTLASLARRTSSTIEALAAANCMNNPRALQSGQVFYLPRRPIN